MITYDPPPPSEANPDVDSNLDTFVMRLLSKEPAARPESAAAAMKLVRAIDPNVATLV